MQVGRIGMIVLGLCGLLGLGVAAYMRMAPDRAAVAEQARKALEDGRFDAAMALIDRLGKPENLAVEDRMLRGQIEIALNHFDEAIKLLDSIPSDSKLAAMARFQAGQMELRRGRVHKAELYYLESVKLEPRFVRPRRELVYIYGMQSRWREIAAEFRELGKTSRLSVDDVILWCLTRSVTWKPEELTEDLRRWVEADPDDRWSRLALAENLARRQYTDEAEKILEQLPADDPDVRAGKARIAMDRGEIDQAEKLLEGGAVNHDGLAKLRGRIALSRRNPAEALKQYQIAYKMDPGNRDTINGLAQSYLMLGKPDEARPFQRLTKNYDSLGVLIDHVASKGIARTPTFFKELGAAYEAVGRVEEARAWYSLVIGADPLDVEAQQALFRLRDPATTGS